MCCFSQPVRSVKATNIFTRPVDDGRQFVVYSMSIEASQDLAMILPLPARTPAKEDDVEFINLKEYPHIFSDLRSGFPMKKTKDGRALTENPVASSASALKVVEVGDFEASFVPTVKDFSRLDERFRLPPDAWNKLPQYKSYSFAVFKLKPGAMTIHPMAFSFPRRERNSLFFPTVHIHDGKVHPKADFDHILYCQPSETQRPTLTGWEESFSHAKTFTDVSKSKGIIDGEQHCYKREMHGRLPNKDTVLAIEL